MQDGYGFIRCANYLPGDNDVYVAPSQIRRFNMKTGDIIEGNTRVKSQGEKFSALLFVKKSMDCHLKLLQKKKAFEDDDTYLSEQKTSSGDRWCKCVHAYHGSDEPGRKRTGNDCIPAKSWKSYTFKKRLQNLLRAIIRKYI